MPCRASAMTSTQPRRYAARVTDFAVTYGMPRGRLCSERDTRAILRRQFDTGVTFAAMRADAWRPTADGSEQPGLG